MNEAPGLNVITPSGKLISVKQLEANRRNAKLSTGPRTKQGKKWSRRNATKHGILSSVALFDAREDNAAYQELLAELRVDLQPLGVLEELLVEDMTTCWWRLRRALCFEAQAMSRSAEREFLKLTGEGDATPEEAIQLFKEAVEEAEKRARDRDEDIPSSLQQIRLPSKEEFRARLQRIRAKRYLDICAEEDVRAKVKELGLEQAFEDAIAARGQQGDAAQWGNSIPLDTRLGMPAEEDMNLILRYESNIYRRLAQHMNQLERLQRARKGEHVPAPLNVNFSTRG